MSKNLKVETTKKREIRLKQIANETNGERVKRLRKDRDRKKIAIETDEQREIRLKKQRDYSRKIRLKKIAIETDEQREIRLKKQKDYSRKRYLLKRKKVIENKKIANERFLVYSMEYQLTYLKERVKRLKGIKKQNVLERIKKLKEVIN